MNSTLPVHPGIPFHGFGKKIASFASQNVVFLVALCAALISSFFIPPDAKYLSYFDWKTLSCLFSVLAVVGALRSVRFFTVLAQGIVSRFTTTRSCFLALVYVTFIGSMFIANDMALLTFLPLGYLVVRETGEEKYMAFLFIMQNISANLGGMLTPFGNPQNLYLYSFFEIPTGEFMSIMLLPFVCAVSLLTICCLLVPRESLILTGERAVPGSRWKRDIYLVLFAISIIMVFRILPYWIGLIIIFISLLFLSPESLKGVDYPLLLTFFCFFIFSGNLSRIPAIRSFFSALLGRNTLLVSILSCQCISNVPSAILLSQFTDNYAQLLRGVNIGGTGTLIASLASLITFREFQKHAKEKTKTYLLLFTGFNLLFLVVLTVICSIF